MVVEEVLLVIDKVELLEEGLLELFLHLNELSHFAISNSYQ